MDRNELAHYGIKGMKWGIRRSEAQLAKARGGGPSGAIKKVSNKIAESKKAKAAKKAAEEKTEQEAKELAEKNRPKKVSEMSDAELRAKINRLQMEEQYNAAMARMNPKTESRAKKMVKDLGEKAVRDVATKAIDKAMKEAFKAPPEVDSITDFRGDLSKMGDKALKGAMNRAVQENTIQKLIKEMDEREKG